VQRVPLQQALFGPSRQSPTADHREPASPTAPEPIAEVHYIQRQTTEQPDTRPAETTDEAQSGQPGWPDLDRLADEVYGRLRRRLKIEAERLGWPGRH